MSGQMSGEMFTKLLIPAVTSGHDSFCDPCKFKVQFTNNVAQCVLFGHGHTSWRNVFFLLLLFLKKIQTPCTGHVFMSVFTSSMSQGLSFGMISLQKLYNERFTNH